MGKRKAAVITTDAASTTDTAKYEERDCTICDGSGLTEDGRRVCGACKGHGKQHRAQGSDAWLAGRSPTSDKEQRRRDSEMAG